MSSIAIEVVKPFRDFELIDSGDGAKLERFGDYLVVRPDPRALWQPTLSKKEWDKADASFKRSDPQTGEWTLKRKPPSDWSVGYDSVTLILKPTSFKHVGIFPEQTANWDWVRTCLDRPNLSVLNLFAYTGGATLAAAAAGAKVTHVDSSRTVINWARDNAKKSGLSEAPIRWIEDDVMKFLLREAKRGNRYDGIIMDPPRFGRGAKGEIWKLETHLPALVDAALAVLSEQPKFLLLNAYTADISSLVLKNLLQDSLKKFKGELTTGELVLQESAGKRLLPSGIFARWRNG